MELFAAHKRFQEALKRLKGQNRLRYLALPSGIDLTSNDYLGMAAHPALREAAIAVLEGGIELGAGGSRLLRGHTQAHENLEAYAADYFSAQKSLFFASGYQANQAIFSALPTRHDVIVYDEYVHASARTAIQDSPARAIKAAHNDINAFEDALRRAQAERRSGGQIWIVVESLYSMDGDFAPLAALHKLALAYDAILIVDEAHATGVWGEAGKGLAAEFMNAGNVITLHTCGKAIGVAGGLVCGPEALIDYLINTARPFIYSTAPMPLQAALVQKSLEILATKDGDARRADLFAHIKAMQKNPMKIPVQSQIIPVICGSDAAALRAASILQQEGFDVRAIRPPTVPEGTARLRVSLSSVIKPSELERFFAALCEQEFLKRDEAA